MRQASCWPAAFLAVSFLVGTKAFAEESASLPLADMCAACHGPDGNSPGSIPSIASLNAEVMRAFLLGFREGDIEATIMGRLTRGLTDAELEDLARHFEGGME